MRSAVQLSSSCRLSLRRMPLSSLAMFATPAHLSKLLPWVDWSEWADCRADLFCHSSSATTKQGERGAAARPLPLSCSSSPPAFSATQLTRLQRALDRIAAWRARGRLPLSVDSTAQLLSVQRDDATGTADVTSLRQQYALCIIRLVNGLVDSSQRSTHALSVASLASSLHLPRLLVDVRHDSTHSQLPSLLVLRYAAWEALRWLWTYYWQQQDSGTDVVNKNISRALQVWRDSTHSANEEERVRGALRELLAAPAATAYLSSVLVSTLFPSSPLHCLRPPSTASFTSSSPTDSAAGAHFASVQAEWHPLLSAVGKRLREFRVEALRHTVTQLVATAQQRQSQPTGEAAAVEAAEDVSEYRDGVEWRMQLLSRWSLHFIHSLSTREGAISLYTNLASLCLLDTSGSCHAVLQALVGRIVALDDQASSEWAEVVGGEEDRLQRRKRQRRTEQLSTSEWLHDEPTLDIMRSLAAVEQPRSTASVMEKLADSGESSPSVAVIELCQEWVKCPIGVLPHQSAPQLTLSREAEQSTDQTVLDDDAVERSSVDTVPSEYEQGAASSERTVKSVPFCSSGWDVPDNELSALRPWQAAISALSHWQGAGRVIQSNG